MILKKNTLEIWLGQRKYRHYCTILGDHQNEGQILWHIMITFCHPTLKNWRKQNSMTTSLYLEKKLRVCLKYYSIPKSQSEDRRNDDHPLELPCSNIWYLTPYVEMLPLEPAIGVPDRHLIVTENGRGIRSGPMEYGWTTSVWWETSWSPVYLVVYSS